MLALLPLAAGCTARHLAPTPEDANPAVGSGLKKERFPGKKVPYCAILALDQNGDPYPDLTSGSLNSNRLSWARYRLAEYFKGDASYDPDRIFDDMADRLKEMCGSDRTLVILIHGFNATLPESRRAYKVTRLQIEHQYPQRKFAYLEIYWDGLYGSPVAIWSTAQCSSKWAGLGLRRLLCRLPDSLPVRILTHSRGASVACAALWNDELGSTPAEDLRYRVAQRRFVPAPLPSLRVGLLAPAMRSGAFDRYGERGEGVFSYHDRFVIGFNPDDAALNCGGLSQLMGSEFGCSPALMDSVVGPLLNRGRAHAFAVDFAGSVEHGFEDYVLRDIFEDEFLPRLFGD